VKTLTPAARPNLPRQAPVVVLEKTRLVTCSSKGDLLSPTGAGWGIRPGVFYTSFSSPRAVSARGLIARTGSLRTVSAGACPLFTQGGDHGQQ
jgi:hypothetical protein